MPQLQKLQAWLRNDLKERILGSDLNTKAAAGSARREEAIPRCFGVIMSWKSWTPLSVVLEERGEGFFALLPQLGNVNDVFCVTIHDREELFLGGFVGKQLFMFAKSVAFDEYSLQYKRIGVVTLPLSYEIFGLDRSEVR